jgi:hypothetical protein
MEERVGALVSLIGFVILAAYFFPGVRKALIFFGMIIGTVLVLFFIFSFLINRRLRKEEEHLDRYLGKGVPTTPSKTQTSNLDVGPHRHGNGPEGPLGSNANDGESGTTYADSSIWEDRLARENSDNAVHSKQPRAFTKELLDALEWRRFEQLVTGYFEKTGLEAKRSHVGADGGVDIKLHKIGESRPYAYVQCKAWHVYTVGVKPVRELFGVMAADGIGTGYFVTTGTFTGEAHDFVTNRDMKLVTGEYLLEKLNSLVEADRSELLFQITRGDYRTPTCPRCDIKMVLRKGSDGEFWGCPNFSKRYSCRQTFKLRKLDSDWPNSIQGV